METAADLDLRNSASTHISEPGTIPVRAVRLADIDPDPTQARDEGADDELAAAIASVGVLTPIRIYEHPTVEGRYIIEDGERRYRGSHKARLERIPAMIVDAPESVGDKLLLQVASNDGKRLKPMEEARTFKRILDDKGWTTQQLADAIGKKKSTIGDRLAILEVPVELLKYFEEGTLSAAAAPILRPLAGLPERARKRVVESVLNDGDFEHLANRARSDGKAISLADLEQEVSGALREELRAIDPKVAGDYKGKTVAVGKTEYAVDVPAYDAAVTKAAAAAAAQKKDAPRAQTSKPVKEKPSEYQLAERKRAAEAKKKAALRRAHFAAISAKLPTTLDAKWSLFAVEHVLDEMHSDSRRAVYQALVAPGPVNGSTNINKELTKYAAGLDAGGRVRMILQLLLGSDLSVSPYGGSGPKRLTAAAVLAKVDLKKVKLPEEPKAAAKKARRWPMPPLYLPEELRRYAGEIGPALAHPILATWPEGSKYHSAEQAEAIARVLIDHVPTHQELVHAQIAFIFREKMATRDRCVWGKASKADGKLSFFAGFDFVIELNWQQWRKLTDHQKLALIDHELEHCGREQDEAGKWSWVLRSHEIEAFNGEVTRWGLWRDDLKVFAGAVGHAQQLGMFEGAHD